MKAKKEIRPWANLTNGDKILKYYVEHMPISATNYIIGFIF